jgi:hypothetical protein
MTRSILDATNARESRAESTPADGSDATAVLLGRATGRVEHGRGDGSRY